MGSVHDVGRICLGEDAGGASDPSLSVGPADGFRGEDTATGRAITIFCTHHILCSWAGRQLLNEFGRNLPRGDGFTAR